MLDDIDVICDDNGKVSEIKLKNMTETESICFNVELLEKMLNEDIRKGNFFVDDIKKIIFGKNNEKKQLSKETIDGIQTLYRIQDLKNNFDNIRERIKKQICDIENNYKIRDLGKKLPAYRKQVIKDIENKKKQIEQLIADVEANKYLKFNDKKNLLLMRLRNNIECGHNLFYNYQTNSFSMKIDTTESEPPIKPFTIKVNFDKKNRLKNVECITTKDGKKAYISDDIKIEGKKYNIKDMFLNQEFGLATKDVNWQDAKGLETFEQFEEIEFAEFEKNFHEYYLRSAEIAKQYGQIQKNIELIKEKKKFRNKRAKLNNKKTCRNKTDIQK